MSAPALPPIGDRETWQAEIDALRVREKAHTRAGDAIAAARRRLPMVEVDAAIPLIGPEGPVTLLDDLRGPPAADRLLPHVVRRPARRGPVRGLHLLERAGPPALVPALTGRHLRHVLPGPVRGERPLPRLHGLGRALVLPCYDAPERAAGRTPLQPVLPDLLAVDVARLRSEQVEKAHLAPVRDLAAEHRLDGVLPVVVLDLPTASNPMVPAGMSVIWRSMSIISRGGRTRCCSSTHSDSILRKG